MPYVSTWPFEETLRTLRDVISESDARGVRNRYHRYGALLGWRTPALDYRAGEKPDEPGAVHHVLSKEVQLDCRLQAAEKVRTRDTHKMRQMPLPLPA